MPSLYEGQVAVGAATFEQFLSEDFTVPLESYQRKTPDLSSRQRNKNLNKYLSQFSGSSDRNLFKQWVGKVQLMDAETEIATIEQRVRACFDHLAAQNEVLTFPSRQELQNTHWEDEDTLQILLDHFPVRAYLLIEVKGLSIGSAVKFVQDGLSPGRQETLLGQIANYMAHASSPLLLLLGPEAGVVVAAKGVQFAERGGVMKAEKMDLHIWSTIFSFNSGHATQTVRPRKGLQIKHMSLSSLLVGLSLLAEQKAKEEFWL
ncbi:unnamed protein product [Sympodiomycopsis kandeliae]